MRISVDLHIACIHMLVRSEGSIKTGAVGAECLYRENYRARRFLSRTCSLIADTEGWRARFRLLKLPSRFDVGVQVVVTSRTFDKARYAPEVYKVPALFIRRLAVTFLINSLSIFRESSCDCSEAS